MVGFLNSLLSLGLRRVLVGQDAPVVYRDGSLVSMLLFLVLFNAHFSFQVHILKIGQGHKIVIVADGKTVLRARG